MKNIFGFGISPSSTVNMDKVDFTLFDRLHELEPDAWKCMSCGSCSATCPAGTFSGMSLRKVLPCLQRGRETEAVKMLQTCVLRGKCSMVRPRGIPPRHVIPPICPPYQDD